MINFSLFEENKELYLELKREFEKAVSYIYLETFIYSPGKWGDEFRSLLAKKAKQGVEVKLLLDDFGSFIAGRRYFSELLSQGGEVRFFSKVIDFPFLLRKTHFRDHRKLILIDDNISYLGSSNISDSMEGWKELSIKIKDKEIAEFAKKKFLHIYDNANNPRFKEEPSIKNFAPKDLQLIFDAPGFKKKSTKKIIHKYIRAAKESIKIINPYIGLDFKLIRALKRAIKRGVKLSIIYPENGNHPSFNIINKKISALFTKQEAEILNFKSLMIHSKVMLIDDKKFLIGSSNLDNRSFFVQYELNLTGDNVQISKALKEYFEKIKKNCIPFNLYEWEKRPFHIKVIGAILWFLRRFL